MVKVLFIAPQPFFEWRGSPIRVGFNTQALAELGYAVELLTLPIGEKKKIPGVHINRVPNIFGLKKISIGPSFSKVLFDFLLLFKGVRLVSKNSYDIIHCEDSEAALMGIILKTVFKKPTIVNFHNRLSDNLRLHNCNALIGLGELVEHLLYSKSDSIIANSEELMQLLEKKHNVNDVTVVLDHIAANECEPNLSLPDSYVAYAGTSAPYQGVPLLLTAFRRVIKEFPDLKLVLIGEMSADVKKMAYDLGVNNNTTISGTLKIEETNYVLKRSLFNVIPRINGVQPGMKALHYLANGTPILATNLQCNTTFLKHGINAYLVEPYELSFAEGMLTLMRDATTRRELRKKILETAADQDIPKLLRKAVATAINRKRRDKAS